MNRCPTCGGTYPPEARFCPQDGARLLGVPAQHAVAATDGTTVMARRQVPADTAPLHPGQQVDARYVVERKIGEGGMSFVYLVRDIASGAPYAMKVLTAGLSADQKAMERLRREASFGMRLAHPNVCHILRLGDTETGLVYVVMPYLEGEILSDRIFKRGQLPLAEVVQHVADIAAGLHVAHGLRIVHRDLKPENVMLCRDDGRERAVVLDFGLAKERRADREVQKLTQTGIILGTPEFMSPEQIRGRPLDGRSDVYALAVMTFEMLTGRLPFAGRTSQEIMVARLRGTPMALAEARPDLTFPEPVERVIRHGLAVDPQARFRTAPDYAAALAGEHGTPTEEREGWMERWFGRARSGGADPA